MKKVLLLTVAALSITGMAMAQTTPKPAKQPAKKEAAAPAKQTDTAKMAKKAGHHHKKHA